jgi:uracil-DNA glycosylase family 4
MIVSDFGPTDADIMLVGEAPGKEEEACGRPFVGYSGKMLKQLLTHSGINFNACYVTNVVDVRPPGNRFSFFYVEKSRKTPSERLEKYWQVLRDKIERLQPKVVIPLGGEALRAIAGKRSISEWRGTPMTYKGVPVLPTYHPRYVMSQYNHHPIVELDLVKARKISLGTMPNDDDNVTLILKPTVQQVVEFLGTGDTAYPRVSFDIETLGKHVRCISVAKRMRSRYHALSIPFFQFPSSSFADVSAGDKMISFSGQGETGSSYWGKSDERIVLDALATLLADKEIEKVGQNSISFDGPLVEDEFGIYISNHHMDTMHAWHVVYPELPKSLSFLCSILTNYANYWTDRDNQNDMSHWRYNAMDGVVTLDVSYKIEDEMKDAGLSDFYFNHVHPLAFALSDASREGVLIDKKARDELVVRTKEKIESVGVEVNDLAGREINPNSTKQVQALLYDEFKFPVMYNKDRRPTTEETALRKLEKRYPSEMILTKIIEYRKHYKLVSTFLDVKTDEDGRMRTSYNASGTENGRISSSQSLWGTGMNLQNIPVGKSRGVENIRNIFVAGEGNVFVKGDLSQAETRVVAHILYRIGDSTLYDLYRDPDFDIHTWMASFIFEKDESEISKHEREVGKLANHSGNYCAGPGVLQKKALKDGLEGIDYRMAQRILEVRHGAIPGLRKWWADVERKLRQTRVLTTCLGRRRIFFGRLDDNSVIRDAVAFEPQSTVGDVCNTIFRRLHVKFRELNTPATPILQVHDEVVVECASSMEGDVVKEKRKASIVPLFINEEPLIIPIDISVGKNWRDCKPV